MKFVCYSKVHPDKYNFEFMLIVFANLLYYTQSSYFSSIDDWDQMLSAENNPGLNSYNQEVRGGIKSA